MTILNPWEEAARIQKASDAFIWLLGKGYLNSHSSVELVTQALRERNSDFVNMISQNVRGYTQNPHFSSASIAKLRMMIGDYVAIRSAAEEEK